MFKKIGYEMATSSFEEIMEIDTLEKAEKLLEAFEAAEKRGPYKYKTNIFEELERGRRHLRGNKE